MKPEAWLELAEDIDAFNIRHTRHKWEGSRRGVGLGGKESDVNYQPTNLSQESGISFM